ncbi:MAG: hypothetical protein IJD96_02885 [Lachnospiraceae bacterium]|nr:hypothetical protein [Lachnospiraceae bacterium]
MILVDVHALQLGEVYDFEVDEDKTADELLGDIVTLICKKENKKQKKEGNYYLYALNKECVLRGALSFREQGIRSGERLVLV